MPSHSPGLGEPNVTTGETIGKRTFDGKEEFAIFPGDLPSDPGEALQGWEPEHGEMRFVRFRPPNPVTLPSGGFASIDLVARECRR